MDIVHQTNIFANYTRIINLSFHKKKKGVFNHNNEKQNKGSFINKTVRQYANYLETFGISWLIQNSKLVFAMQNMIVMEG